MVRYPSIMAREKAEFVRGTKVGVRFGGRVRRAVILEDRGIVFSGRRIVRVRLGDDPNDADALEWEIPAEELEPLPAAA